MSHAMEQPKSKKAGNKKIEAGRQTSSPVAFWLPLVVVLATAVPFSPSLQNGFVDWDDFDTLLENSSYRGFGWKHLRWMFTTFHTGHYQPLTWLTFALDYQLWGMEPFGYHLTSLFFHCANALIFYLLAFRLLSLALPGSGPRAVLASRVAAGMAALLFAVHPLRVESVAWATERRDVVSGFFYLWTLFCYLRAVAACERRSYLRWLALAVFVYGLSLLSKSVGMTLPLVLVLFDIYPLRRLGGGGGKWLGPAARSIWWEKIPFLVLGSLFGIMALLAQGEAGALKALGHYDPASRLAQALFGIAFYIWKTLVPIGLSPLYELPLRLNPWEARFVLSGLVILAITLTLFAVRRRFPAGWFVWVYYIIVLSPVLGVAQSGPQMVADRYSYLSCLGWAVLAGGGLLYGWRLLEARSVPGRAFVALLGLVVSALFFLGGATWKQAQIWRDSETLWRRAVAISEDSSTAHYNLALELRRQGRLSEAVEHYRKSLANNPLAPDAHYNLAIILAEQGKIEEAIEHNRRAVEINSRYWDAHNNLGILLERQGRIAEAIEHYRKAAEINPAAAEAQYNLAMILVARGEIEGGVRYFREVLRIKPDWAGAHFHLATTLVKQGRIEEATEHYQETLRLEPEFVEAYHSLGRVMAAQGRLDRAIELFREAVRLQPNLAQFHESLARALAEKGRRDEAVKHYREALRILKSQRAASTSGP